MITDMTQGKTSEILWKFSLPMLGSSIFQQLYNMADSIIAGRWAGNEALAAVGTSYPITMIFMAVAMGCNIGCSIVISQKFGSKAYSEMKTAVYTSFISTIILSIVITFAGLELSAPMLHLLHTPDKIFTDAQLYLNIYIGGLFFLFLYNICTGIFTALGDSRTPLYFLIVSSLGNIVLDLIFVIPFKMGVGGVAWATFIAQGLSSIFAFFALIRRLKTIHTSQRTTLFSFSMLGRISLIAIPSILQQSFISVGNLCIQGLVNSCGWEVIAGYSAAIKLNTFTITSLTTLANGVSSFTAQNIGANQIQRVKEGFKSGLSLMFKIAVPIFIIYFFAAKGLVGFFMKQKSDISLQTGVYFLKIVSPFYMIVGTKLIADAVLRGSGVMRYFMISTFTDLILRVMISYLLKPLMGATGIWLSWPIGWVIGMILALFFYFKDYWQKGMCQQG